MDQDFRTRRTKSRIQQAFIGLLNEVGINKVTVSEIIQRAKISRRSFYVHYHDKYDLLDQIEQTIKDDLRRDLRQASQELRPVKGFNDQQLRWNTERTFDQVLRAMQEHQMALAVLLSTNGDPQFKKQVQMIIQATILDRLKEYNAYLVDDIPADYVEAILVGNLLDLIVIWLQKPHPESIQKFAQILTLSRLVAPLQLLRFK